MTVFRIRSTFVNTAPLVAVGVDPGIRVVADSPEALWKAIRILFLSVEQF